MQTSKRYLDLSFRALMARWLDLHLIVHFERYKSQVTLHPRRISHASIMAATDEPRSRDVSSTTLNVSKAVLHNFISFNLSEYLNPLLTFRDTLSSWCLNIQWWFLCIGISFFCVFCLYRCWRHISYGDSVVIVVLLVYRSENPQFVTLSTFAMMN